MKSKISQSQRVSAPTFVVLLTILLAAPFVTMAQEQYRFERLWPALSHPWYFASPSGIAVDGSDNVYVLDSEYYRVQKFTSDGVFITKWGNAGSGDGQFGKGDFGEGPQGIAVDNSGFVYVADTLKNRIQKFTASGVFVAKWTNTAIQQGSAWEPKGIAVDNNGFVYVASRHGVHKFSANGSFVSTFELGWPLVADSTGSIYVAANGSNLIKKLSADGQVIAEWEGYDIEEGGIIVDSLSLAIDGSGYLHVAALGFDLCRIHKFTGDGQLLSKWEVESNRPRDIAVDSNGVVYIADTSNNQIQRITNDGQLVTKWTSWGNVDGIFGMWGNWSKSNDIAMDSSGFVYVADSSNNRIQKFTASGQFLSTWGSLGTGDGEFRYPCGVAVDTDNDVYVVDKYNERVQKFTANGEFLTKWGAEGTGDDEFSDYAGPSGIAVDDAGYVYVVDTGNYRIQKFTSDGQFVTKWGSFGDGDGEFGASASFALGPEDVAVGENGSIYVADSGNTRIQKFTSDGRFVAKWGAWGSDDGEFAWPSGIDVDSSGYAYVVDTYNNRIQKFSADGQFVSTWGSYGSDQGKLSWPVSLAVDSTGQVFVYDAGNNRVQVFQQVPPPPLNITSLRIDLGSPATVGSPVEITFYAQGLDTPFPPSYRYYQASGYQTQDYGNWAELGGWVTNNSVTWTPASEDHYIIVAYVTGDPNGDIYHQAGLSIETSGNSANPIQLIDFTTDIDYPQASGEAITIDTTVTSGTSTLYYRYYYRKLPAGQWTTIKAYDTNSSCTWTPPGDGLYVVVVQVTDNPSGNAFSTAGMTCTIGE